MHHDHTCVIFRLIHVYSSINTRSPQVSVEERTCGPPETPAPAAPETDSTRPDVIPPVYDDLNTLSRKVSVVSFFWCRVTNQVNDVVNAEGGATINANVPCVGRTYSC